MVVPRPTVVCPSCGELHEQAGRGAVCGDCGHQETREDRQATLGGRAGVRARCDLDAAARDPTGPFGRAFRAAFFRPETLFEDGAESVLARLRELHASRIAVLERRAGELRAEYLAEGRRLGYAEGYAAGLRDGRREAA